MNRTHYVQGFTRRDAKGRQETACGQFVALEQVAKTGIEPTCWGCATWLKSLDDTPMEDDRADHLIPPRRRLTRYEQLEALADAGCDTREEYEGLR